MSTKLKDFTDKEIYVLLRAFMESSYTFTMEDKYSKDESDIHNKLLNELSEENKKRIYGGNLK